MRMSILRWCGCWSLALLSTITGFAQFTAFNDHAPGPGTAPNTTTWDVLGAAPGSSGLLKDIDSGTDLPVALTITRTSTGVAGASTQGSPAPGTPLYTVFNGLVDFQGTPNPSIELTGNGMVTYTFTGLDPKKRYGFRGSAVRGVATYTNRWTLFEIVGASAFTPAHSANTLTTAKVPAITSAQVAINTGVNYTPDTGDLAGWDDIDPGPDGSFAVTCQQYTGTVPGGGSNGIKGYGMTGIRLQEFVVAPTPVAITRQPESQTVSENQPATFAVTATGNPAPSYQWYQNGQLIPAATNATLTLEAAPLTDDGASFYVIASNQVNGQSISVTSDSALLHIHAFQPGTFTPQDIGTPAQAGTVAAVPGGYDLTASGTDIGGAADQCFFAFQQTAGDFDFQVRIEALDAVNAWTKAGLIARTSLSPASPFAAILTTPSLPGTFFESRAISGSAASTAGRLPSNHPATWLRLQRHGNVLTGFGGFDGQVWQQLGSLTATLPNSIPVGFTLASHETNAVATGRFRDFGPTQGVRVGPVSRPAEVLGACTRKTGLVISEIMYKPAPRTDGLNLEFVEVFNSNPFFEDVSGYRLGGQIDFTFPDGTRIPGGGFLVVAGAPADVKQVYGLSAVLGPFTGSLKTHDGSGSLQLLDKIGSVLLDFSYSKDPPWPVAADGTGHSLVLARASYGEANPRAWTSSDVVGGSPGAIDAFRPSPLRSVLINEVLVAGDGGRPGFIELYNGGTAPADLSGCALSTDPVLDQFVIPAGTVLPAGAFVAFDEDQTGLHLSTAGETLYFKDRADVRVLDVLDFGGQASGVAYGRSPDGGPEFYPLTAPSPGASNSAIRISDVVINEIMYKPVSGDENDSYVELYNQSSHSVDLSAWQLSAGVKYTFPSGTSLEANGYVVVAKNVTNLLARYSTLRPNNTFGPFSGKLAGSGERLELSMPVPSVSIQASGKPVTNNVYVAVDEVQYGVGGRWGQWANGGGSSLELIDPHANHRLASNWADSDESQKAQWTTVEATGRLDLGSNYETKINHFQLGILDTGECLVDDVEVIPAGPGTNVVMNSGFETALNGWSFQGDHVQSSLESPGFDSATCLHVRCTDRLWTGANSVQGTLTNSTLAAGQTATLRFKARWLHGAPDVLLRLNGNWMEAPGTLPVPLNLGTPGAPNSRAVPNAPPAFYNVAHSPALPAANEQVVVTARVDDPDGVQSVVLHYRLDPATTYLAVPMSDDGTGPDLIANDGIYSAAIPGKPAGTLAAFYLEAVDRRSATARFPALVNDNAPDREGLVLFGDPAPLSAFGTYHHWVTQANISRWISLTDLSNESVDGTFVYGNRIIYNMRAHYAGSPFHQQFDSPIGSLCHYKWEFPDDDQFLGTTSFNKIHQPGNGPGDDTTLQREQTFYWILRQLGLPWNYRRYVAVYVNGHRRGTLMEDTQVPDGDVVKEHFPSDNNGDLYKLQPWFEFDPSGRQFNYQWCMLNNYLSGGAKKLARYRWNFLSRKNSAGPNNYTNVFALIDAVSQPANSPDLLQSMDALADTELWMRTFAASHSVGDWDHVGTQNAQNMYAYKPAAGKWTLFLWDCNILLGNSGCWSPGQNLLTFTGGDQGMGHLYATYPYRRALYRAYKEIAGSIMDPTGVGQLLDAKYAAFQSEGISPVNPATIKTWIAQARTSILNQVNNAGGNTPLNLNVSDGTVVTNSQFVLTGTAPVEVKSLSVNGVSYPLNWTSITQWNVEVPLRLGINSLQIQGFDVRGQALAAVAQTVQVVLNNPASPALLSVSGDPPQPLTFTWTAQPGKTYRLEANDDLSQTTWTALGETTASDVTASASDPAPSTPHRFYRVKLLNP